jgi:hypothetical protein
MSEAGRQEQAIDDQRAQDFGRRNTSGTLCATAFASIALSKQKRRTSRTGSGQQRRIVIFLRLRFSSVSEVFEAAQFTSENGWWLGAESNRRHEDFQSSALPTELPSRRFAIKARAFIMQQSSSRASAPLDSRNSDCPITPAGKGSSGMQEKRITLQRFDAFPSLTRACRPRRESDPVIIIAGFLD